MRRTTPLLTLLAAVGVLASCGQRLIGRLPDAAAMHDGIARVDANDANDANDVGDARDVGDASDGADAAKDAPVDQAADGETTDGPPVIPDLPPVCTWQGWCWTHPLPMGDRFVQVAQNGPDDVWLLGASGAILRFGGGVWSTVPPAPTGALSMWVSAGNDVLVGGTVGPYHWDGGSWTQVPIGISPQQRASKAMWGCAPNNVWIVGPAAFNWNGSELVSFDMPIEAWTRTVWGSGCNDVWAGTMQDFSGAGRILRFTGSAWSEITSQPAEQIAGTGPDDVWSLAQGQLTHWSAPGAGTLVDSRTSNLFAIGTTAVGTMNEGRIISVRARGGAVTPLSAPVPANVGVLSGRSADDIWGVGVHGVAAHWDGTAWISPLPAWSLTDDDIVKVTGSGVTDVWAATKKGGLLHWNGSFWATALTPQQTGGQIHDIWARAADDVWVLGDDDLVHRWDGHGWNPFDPLPRATPMMPMRAITATGPNDIWILRDMNSLLHFDGAGWTSRTAPLARPTDIWAAAPDQLWVVGDDAVYRSYGIYFDPVKLPANFGIGTRFTAITGNRPTEIWVTSTTAMLKANDAGTELLLVAGNPPLSMAAAPGGGAWVMADTGSGARRLDFYMPVLDPYGINIPTSVSGPAELNDLWVAPDGTMWAGGAGGTIVRRSPAP